MSIENHENASDSRNRRVERLYQELHDEITRLCEQADAELAMIQRQDEELRNNDEPA